MENKIFDPYLYQYQLEDLCIFMSYMNDQFEVDINFTELFDF